MWVWMHVESLDGWDDGYFPSARIFVEADTCWVVSLNVVRVVEFGRVAFFFLTGGCG